MSSFEQALRALPKAELHVHLDGSLRLQTLSDLDRVLNTGLPRAGLDAIRTELKLGAIHGSLEDYLQGFTRSLAVLQTAPGLRRVAQELVEDAARESIHHLEVRLCPDLHCERGLSTSDVLEAVRVGLAEGERRFGISFGILVSAMRHRSEKDSERLAELAVSWKDRGVVGFDLAGIETGNPCHVHTAALARVKKAALGLTLHAGEVTSARAVAEALDCGADRIGHGTQLRDDPALLERLVESAVPLEMCPSSNVQTGAVAGYNDHPALDYLRAGLCVCINTDSRLMSQTTVTDELMHLFRAHRLTWKEAITLCDNSFFSCFISEERKKELSQRLELMAAKLKPLIETSGERVL